MDRILVCHSPYVQCGVRQYGEQLDRALMLKVECPSFTFSDVGALLEAAKPGDVALFHFEPGAVGSGRDSLWHCIDGLKRKGVKSAFVCHYFEAGVASDYKNVDLFILHREYPDRNRVPDRNFVIIPHGCPVYDVMSEARRNEFRAKKKWTGKMVVTTVGFLTSWKQTPMIVESLLRSIATRDVLFVVHGSRPIGTSVAPPDEPKLKLLEKRFSGRLQFTTDFLPEEDLLDLVSASDLGFVYHGVDSGSVSGATKQFVSARCPVVITSSSHASDLQRGIVRVLGRDATSFCREVARVIGDGDLRERLRVEQEENYAELNWEATADKFVDALSRLG
jgi:hypothetical protein